MIPLLSYIRISVVILISWTSFTLFQVKKIKIIHTVSLWPEASFIILKKTVSWSSVSENICNKRYVFNYFFFSIYVDFYGDLLFFIEKILKYSHLSYYGVNNWAVGQMSGTEQNC